MKAIYKRELRAYFNSMLMKVSVNGLDSAAASSGNAASSVG